MNASVQSELDRLFRTDSRYILAALIRLVGDFDLAEESIQEAFASAAAKWPTEGIPANPRSWLISTARFKAIDRMRRDQRVTLGQSGDDFGLAPSAEFDQIVDEQIEDDMLRLIFICSHPDLSIEAQVALTLREVCGLSTEEVAKAFLLPVPTMAQRLSRAKSRLRDNGAVLESPTPDQWNARLNSVLKVIYLVFNEGYYSSSGDSLTTARLSEEAIRLAELLSHLISNAEIHGLIAMMRFAESRRTAREQNGRIVLLEDQDRSKWDQSQIEQALASLAQSLHLSEHGYYALQAMLAAEHAKAETSEATDWLRIVQVYDHLYAISPSPVIKLNQAVAVAMSGQIEPGLAQIVELIENGQLRGYGLAHAARADLLRRLGRFAEAVPSYEEALSLSQMSPEKKFLKSRIREMEKLIAEKNV